MEQRNFGKLDFKKFRKWKFGAKLKTAEDLMVTKKNSFLMKII